MTNKALGIIFVIFGIIALVGSIMYFLVISAAGEAIAALDTDPAVTEQLGIGDTNELADVLSTFLTLGWIWGISIIISGLASIWAGMRIIKHNH